MGSLPDFVPVEKLFPHWVLARPFIDAHIPDQLSFCASAKGGLIEIDWSWAESLLFYVPFEDEFLYLRLIEQVQKTIAEKIPVEWASSHIGSPFLCGAVDAMNAEIAYIDNGRKGMGLPSFSEVIRHCLGIRHSGVVSFSHYGRVCRAA